MAAFFTGVVAARIAVVLCVLVIALPYRLRRRQLGSVRSTAVPYLRRLWPHFWVGYTILALATIRAGTVMPAMRRADRAGIQAATVAFLVLLFEIALGLNLKERELSGRQFLRQLHFTTMVVFVIALIAHLWLNALHA
jgi:hypothetical protein